jgi:hypothetical protein
MTAHARREVARALRLTRQQVADLLSRYPRVSDEDTEAIREFLRTGRHFDIGMLTADERLKPQLDAFMREHGKHFRVGAYETVALVAAIVALLALFWLVWEALRPATAA